MDCRCENAAYSLVRVETLLLQGLLRGCFLFIFGVAAIPITPFIVGYLKCKAEWGGLSPWRRLLRIPNWIVVGCLYAFLIPLGAFATSIADTIQICRAEWDNRWRTGIPKNPDGSIYIGIEDAAPSVEDVQSALE